MDTSTGNAVEDFKTFTGCQNDAEARQLIDACGGNVEAAVDLYFNQQQPSSSNGYDGPSSSRRRVAHQPKTPPQQLRRSTRNRSAPNLTKKESKNEQNDEEVMVDSDYVRPPIMPVRGPIVEQSFQEQYQRPRRMQANSIFDSFRNYQGAGGGGEQGTSFRELSGIAARRSALQNLFRPPFDILFSGNWEAARAEAERVSMWLLVNVQDVQEFACQALNRDVWSNASVKELVKSNFVFWQVYHDSADGARIENYYHLTTHPAIFAVDPRTGELLEHFRAPDAVAFCDQIGSFLSSNPDFATRDRRITGVAGSAVVANGNHSIGDEDVSMTPCSSNGVRKRPHEPDEDSLSSSSSFQNNVSKKARTDALDVDEILDRGNKLTTVDCDDWLKHLGSADGHSQKISLLLKFPDGNRRKIDVEDTTPLKAVFMLAAGLGYSQREHMLTLFYPKREYLFENGSQTMRQLCFNKQEVIHIERK